MTTQNETQATLSAALGTIKFTQSFKTRTSEDGKKTKREAVVVEFPRPDVEAITSPVLQKIVDTALVDYVKRQFIENGDDANWLPNPAEITVENLYADLTAPSKRGQRFLTAAKLKDFAYHFTRLSTEKLGKSAGGAALGAELVQEKFAKVLGKKDLLEKMAGWLLELQDYLPENQILVGEKLMELLADALAEFDKPEVSADMLD